MSLILFCEFDTLSSLTLSCPFATFEPQIWRRLMPFPASLKYSMNRLEYFILSIVFLCICGWYISSRVEIAGKFDKFLYVTKLIFHFIKFSRRLPGTEFLLIQFNFIKLPKRCILNLAAIPRHEVLLVSLRNNSNFESSCDLNNFTAISMQIKLQSHYQFQSSVIFSVLSD